MKIGDKTKEIWSGDIVTECEFLGHIDGGKMLFYDVDFKCFRAVYFEIYEGNTILNGWTCAKKPSELI